MLVTDTAFDLAVSRVSQSTSRYMYGSSSSAAKTYQPEQQAHYGYDSSGYPRSSGGGSSSGRYNAEVYASSGSSSSWYREQPPFMSRLGVVLIGALLFRLRMRCGCSAVRSPFCLAFLARLFFRPGRPA